MHNIQLEALSENQPFNFNIPSLRPNSFLEARNSSGYWSRQCGRKTGRNAVMRNPGPIVRCTAL